MRSVLDLSPVDFDYQVWNDPTGYDTLIRTYGPNRPAQEEPKEFTPELRALVLENYETNVISIAREHPETQFYFVFPPGNMFFWDYVSRYGEFDQYLAAMETVIGEMLPLENVRVFQFVDDADKTEDLDRYKDRVHFDPAIMSEIISDVAAGRHEVTADTLESTMQSVRDHWQNRDYDALYAGYTAE